MNHRYLDNPTPRSGRHRAAGCLAAGAFLVLFPKCIGCVMAYFALGTGLGLAGREICGSASGENGFAAIVRHLAVSGPIDPQWLALSLLTTGMTLLRITRTARATFPAQPQTTPISCCR